MHAAGTGHRSTTLASNITCIYEDLRGKFKISRQQNFFVNYVYKIEFG